MLWLALHLPRLSLEAWLATLPPSEPGAAPRPAALLREHHLQVLNPAAAEQGLVPGMKRATALALAPALLLAEAEPARDAAALAAVVHVALGFTPAVCTQGPQTVLLELQGSLRLFGGLAQLRTQLAAALGLLNAPVPHQLCMATAPTALGAALLAQGWPQRHRQAPAQPRQASPAQPRQASLLQTVPPSPPGPGPQVPSGNAGFAADPVLGPHARSLPALRALLEQMPVWLLGPGREHWEALQGMGLHTLADLRALPRSGLARRFGAGLLEDLDRAFGERADPREWLTLPPAFESRVELHQRAETTEQVLHGAALLLARLLAWARARGARVAGFVLRMGHERRREQLAPPTVLALALAEPSLDATHLQLLLRERLSRVQLPAPTLELQLHCNQLAAGAAPSGELFPSPQSEREGLARLLERLAARLGERQVQRLVPLADHRPEKASRRVPAAGTVSRAGSGAGPGAGPGAPPPGGLLHHPAWLLPEPVPLAERDAMPLWRGRPLQVVGGPERIETGWWDESGPVARDYYIALAEDGALVWLFRSRLPAPPGAPAWFMQGLYA